MKDCQAIPSQYINAGIPKNSINSLKEASAGKFFNSLLEKPNIAFIQDLKKKVGPMKYKNIIKKRAHSGNRSKKNEKNSISEMKNIDPGKPRNINILSRVNKNSLGHMQFSPFISVISLVLNLRDNASTSKNEFVEIKA